MIHAVRVQTFRRLEALRLQQQFRQEELERRVQERTAELVDANMTLRTEIAERQRVEMALRESEEQYRDLVENINDVIYSHDEHGTITYMSPVVETPDGYHIDDIVGRSFTEFIHPDDLPALLESAQRTLAGQLEPSEFRVVTKSGEYRWVRSSSRPIVREGHVLGMRGLITDITDRHRAEEETRALLALARDISGTLDRNELLARVQRRTAEALPCEIVATFYWDSKREVFHLVSQYGIPHPFLSAAEALAFSSNEPFGGRIAGGQPVVINDVSEQSVLVRTLFAQFNLSALVAVPLRVRERHLGALVACTKNHRQFSDNQVEFCSGIARQLAVGLEAAELYRQQQEEAEIAAVLARVGRELIASLSTPVILQRLCQLTTEVLGGSGSCTFLWQADPNAYVCVAHWGFLQEYKTFLSTIRLPPEMAASLVSHLQSNEVVEMSRALSSDLIAQAWLRQLRLEAAIFLRLQRGQEFIGLQICGYQAHTDFTSRQSRIAQGIAQVAALILENAKLFEELERANSIKEDFVGTMSHELRTPLSVIIGYTDLMSEETFGPLAAEQTDVLAKINKNARELLDLVNATLDLSRLQNQERHSLLRQEVQGEKLLKELENDLQPLQPSPALQLEWRIAAPLPPLYTDVMKLKMILKNLITNALKFTDTGAITVSALPQHDGVEFVVADTGIGIPRTPCR